MYNAVKFAPIIYSAFKDTYWHNVNSMESDKEVISKLKFIGKIQKGDKINVKYMLVQPRGITTTVYRTLITPDNRGNTLNFVRNTINRSFEIISAYTSSAKRSQRHIGKNVLIDLKVSKNGLKNLKETYVDDIKFCCDMDTILQEIDAKLVEMSENDSDEDEESDDDTDHKKR